MNVLINIFKVSGFSDQLPRTPLWRSSRRRESLHSPAPIGPGTPKRGCSYRRVFLMYRTRGYDPLVHKKNPGRRMRGGEPKPTRASIGHGGTTRGPAQRTIGQTEGPEPVSHGSSDPMREAGARTRRSCCYAWCRGVHASPGIVMVALQTPLHNALMA